jgi:hypothetical protein
MLSLLNHGAFNQSVNPEWDKNPYNAALGGPCATPQDFFTNAQARDLFKQRLRYIVARWGYSTHLMAWEWWNEIDFTPLSNPTIFKPWLQEMTAALRSWEPFPHLKTTSYAHTPVEAIYSMPEIDFVQRHEYSTTDPIYSFTAAMSDLRAFGKPAFYGEFGGMGEDTSSLDKVGLHLHTAQWASLMTKAAATSMSWYWDNYIEPLKLYNLFNEQTAFLKQENLATAQYQPIQPDTGGSTDFAALALKSDKRILGWVKNNSYSYAELKSQYEKFLLHGPKGGTFTPNYPEINSASLSISKVTPGTYRVEWWSTTGQGLLKTDTVVATATTLTVPVPTFRQDLAFKLILI